MFFIKTKKNKSIRVKVFHKIQMIKAVFNTGATSCCMALRTIRRIFLKEKRPERLPDSVVRNLNASGREMNTEGKLNILFNIGGK